MKSARSARYDKKTSDTVRSFILQSQSKGLSLPKIAEKLKGLGIKTPSGKEPTASFVNSQVYGMPKSEKEKLSNRRLIIVNQSTVNKPDNFKSAVSLILEMDVSNDRKVEILKLML